MSQETLALTCVVCAEPIDTRRNYANGPEPKHVRCLPMNQQSTSADPAAELERQLRYWTQALASGATTGHLLDTTATLAEHPEQSAWWDYADADGTLRMTWVEIWARGCPGEPGPAGRFEDRLPCRYKHLHRTEDFHAVEGAA